MNLLFWGLTIGLVGKVLLAIGVLIAHGEIAHERKIDKLVLRSFRVEYSLTIAGILLIIAGYFMEIHFYEFTSLLYCHEEECLINTITTSKGL